MKTQETVLQLLDPSGEISGSPPLDEAQVREALRLMLLSRVVDDLCIKLQRLNRLGVYGPAYGQEATIVGTAMALNPARDWMVPASREQVAWIHHGLPLDGLLAMYMGRLDRSAIPPGVRMLPRQQAIGSQLPHAAGLAWAMKIKCQRVAVMTYCGEGASSEGDFHEACNLVGVMKAPLVVVVINNQYAISTSARQQTAGSLAARAAGYGFPGMAVDGNDLFAV